MTDISPCRLILASASAARRRMLIDAGVVVEVEPVNIDERAVQDVLIGGNSEVEPADIAELLAEAKARDVSSRNPGAFVIGADQVLEWDTALITKSADLEAAKATLKRLRGTSHQLHSGVVLVKDGDVLWSTVETASLTMRTFSDAFIDTYIATEGPDLCGSVGAYKLEGRGIQLFERIEGDYFTILGMPLLPLLAQLRVHGAIAI